MNQRRHSDKSVGTTKVRVARAREIQKPAAAADFIWDRLLGVKLKAKKIFWGLKLSAWRISRRWVSQVTNCLQLLFDSQVSEIACKECGTKHNTNYTRHIIFRNTSNFTINQFLIILVTSMCDYIFVFSIKVKGNSKGLKIKLYT